MEFHPGKCQTIRITNKKKPSAHTYFIHDTPVSITDSAKYLGVIIDSKLNWKKQYDSISRKCNSSLAFLRRNLGSAATHIKVQCYTTVVRPSAEYASQVWDPLYKSDIDLIEKIQKRGARFATGNFNMESGSTALNYSKLGWSSLEERRLQAKLITFQKSKLNLLDLPLDKIPLKNRRTRHGGEFFRSFSAINGHISSFFHQTPLLWNSLPADVRVCTTIQDFSTKIKNLSLIPLKSKLTPTF